MEYILWVTFIGFAAGIIGTGLGGLISFFINNRESRFMSVILEFSAGLMLSVVCFDLLPHAFEFGGVKITILGVIIGVFSIIFLENLIKVEDLSKKVKGVDGRLLKVGILTAIGIGLHNFPEGIAVGSGFDVSQNLGFSITLVIAIHDIPEGLAMALPLRASGVGRIRTIFYTIIAGIPMGFGAFLGAVLGGISDLFIAMCFGFAGGAMLYIICEDLIPESKRMYRGKLSTIGNILGIILGIIISKGT